MSNFYAATSLIGGGLGALDNIDGAELAGNDGAVVITDDTAYFYHLNATSGEEESPPDIIAPDNNAGDKQWILNSIYDGVGTFVALTDTPANYTGNAGKYAKVNATEDALEFDTPAGGNGGVFVDRGDPAAKDFTHADLTQDNTWRDLDLSGIVGANEALVLLRVILYDNVAQTRIRFRKNGNSNEHNIASVFVSSANQYVTQDCLMVCDSAGKIEYQSSTTINFVYLTVAGWWLL